MTQGEERGGLGGVTFGHPLAFWLGVAAVTGGVLLHLPMYLMGKDNGYRLAGMPMETPMKVGMAAILVGLVTSLYGLIPRNAAVTAERVGRIRVSALDDAPLTAAHYGLLVTMMLAVTIDIMKPTALAFVMPGMTTEYGLKGPLNPHGTIPVAYVSLSGIVGTVLGSFLWGWLGDRIGRRETTIVAQVMAAISTVLLLFVAQDFVTVVIFYSLVLFFAQGAAAPFFAYVGESYPTRMRGSGAAFINVAGPIGGIFGPLIYSVLQSNGASPTFAAASGAVAALIAAACLLAARRIRPGQDLAAISH